MSLAGVPFVLQAAREGEGEEGEMSVARKKASFFFLCSCAGKLLRTKDGNKTNKEEYREEGQEEEEEKEKKKRGGRLEETPAKTCEPHSYLPRAYPSNSLSSSYRRTVQSSTILPASESPRVYYKGMILLCTVCYQGAEIFIRYQSLSYLVLDLPHT